MNPLSWLRNRVREAVLAGIEDGLQALDDTPDTRPAVEALEARIRPQLPAPEEKARKKGGAP